MFKLSISYTLHRISHRNATSIFDTVLTALLALSAGLSKSMSCQTVLQSRQDLILYFCQCHASLLKIEPRAFKKVVALVRVDIEMWWLLAYFVNPACLWTVMCRSPKCDLFLLFLISY